MDSSDKMVITADGFRDDLADPKVTVLNFSGGKQSTALLYKVLWGELDKPDPFIVLNADPGMENSRTYAIINSARKDCDREGVLFETVSGPSLRDDLLGVPKSEETRIDNPPYWVVDEKGKRGRLTQKCTGVYKIAPMDRYIRQYLRDHFGINPLSKRLPYACVEKWIGFTKDEAHRIKPPKQKYMRFRYPLVEEGMKKSDTVQWYIDRGITIPPTSVCNACFANGAEMFQDMYHNRPAEWEEAVRIDESIRDMRHLGITGTCYVYRGCVPLTELADNGFDGAESTDDSCDSGYCFV